MKKIVCAVALCLLFNSSVYAKDYAKIQIREMEKAQKYNTTDRYYADYSKDCAVNSANIKDPKLIHLSGYTTISADKLKAKEASDNIQYAQIKSALIKKKTDNYNVQAYGEDFYKVYRVAEKIIRANNLDYMNWRMVFSKDNSFNASSSETNCITIHAGAYDSLSANDDALALLIGHEIAHSILGHQVRASKYIHQINSFPEDSALRAIAIKAYVSDSKKMEYAADTVGAQLAARAGYDLAKAKETLSFIYTMDNDHEFSSTHPTGKHRLENYAESRKYFMEEEMKKQGVYNLYNSEVLKPRLSSDRKSLIIEKSESKAKEESYCAETPVDLYTRYAYKSYLNGDFKKAEEYFGKLLELSKNNPVAYLYFSYTEEYLYKKTGKKKYLENAKAFASYAQKLDPENKFINEQVDSL